MFSTVRLITTKLTAYGLQVYVSQSERLQEHRWVKGLFGPEATIPLAAPSVLARVTIHKYIPLHKTNCCKPVG